VSSRPDQPVNLRKRLHHSGLIVHCLYRHQQRFARRLCSGKPRRKLIDADHTIFVQTNGCHLHTRHLSRFANCRVLAGTRDDRIDLQRLHATDDRLRNSLRRRPSEHHLAALSACRRRNLLPRGFDQFQ
jgi:hypothetical protein